MWKCTYDIINNPKKIHAKLIQFEVTMSYDYNLYYTINITHKLLSVSLQAHYCEYIHIHVMCLHHIHI